MKCSNCGFEIEETAQFCGNCGAKVEVQAAEPEVVAEQTAANEAASEAANGAAGPEAAPAGAQPQPAEEPRHYEIPIEYKPISMWGYFGYTFLFSLPLIGLVFMLVFAFGGTKNKNLQNFSRSQFCWTIILVILVIVGLLIFGISSLLGML